MLRQLTAFEINLAVTLALRRHRLRRLRRRHRQWYSYLCRSAVYLASQSATPAESAPPERLNSVIGSQSERLLSPVPLLTRLPGRDAGLDAELDAGPDAELGCRGLAAGGSFC